MPPPPPLRPVPRTGQASSPRPARRGRLGALLLALLLPVAACAPQPLPAPRFGQAQGIAGAPALAPLPAGPARQRVVLLLPLSGGNRALGEAMLNAAQLALFDQADPRVELLPRDTGGSPAAAAEAVRGGLAEGARAFAGPLTLDETAAAAGPARAAGTPVFAFTSDATQAQPGVWVLGITPAEQAERMAEAASAAGARRLGLLVPENEFGRRLSAAFRARVALLGLPAPVEATHGPRGDIAQAAALLAERAGPDGLDAVLLGEAGAQARAAAAAIAASPLPRRPRLMGTALWVQDTTLGQEPALAGAWFPGPDPAARQAFEGRFVQAFGARPPPRSGLAYDAAALAARSVRDGGGAAVAPVGEPLLGADGPIRLLPDGLARRGLAILAVDPSGEAVLVEPAPVPPDGRPGA